MQHTRWQLETLYTIDDVKAGIASIQTALSNQPIDVAEQVERYQQVARDVEEWSDFIYCLYAEDVTRVEVHPLLEEIEVVQAMVRSEVAALDTKIAALSQEEWEALVTDSPYAFFLNERRDIQSRRAPLIQEQLLQDLGVDGFQGWGQLYDQRFMALRVDLNGKQVTIGQGLHEAMFAPDRSARLAAAIAVDAACAKEADLFATILNRISGFRLQSYKMRNWEQPLTELLEQNRISEASLKAMIEALDQHRDLFHAYYVRKIAQAEQVTGEWHDFETNTYRSARHVPFETAQAIVSKQFKQLNPKLGAFAENVFNEGWVDAENRPGKAEGGFCAAFPIAKESRIFMTYRDSYPDVATLAHEFGHAYHNYVLQDEPYLNQVKGTSIAETASTFMENLVLDAAIKETTEREEVLALLEVKIREGLKYASIVPGMFRFEQRFYAERQHGTINAERLSELLQEEERLAYGPVLPEPARYKWMYISHLFNPNLAFYNIPYTIGYLLSNSLYQTVQADPSQFSTVFDAVMHDSGQATIDEIVKRHLDADPTSIAFWVEAQQPLVQAIEQYLSLTESSLSVD
ncbi:M3 family oligoendopeptidase [Exiguobacterium acetylicum]|uniref:M3 family oligoendopeptidase n=1 Tax=Exiguobacterium TaxID=33986 RepID=UPI0027E0AA89|nr:MULTISPECIES: M3 family oligoendopeptidase [Exiguobacterium]MDQ6466324.1 M3 family oligoendopeptidase [Exiguobacterium acetylicum]